MHQAFGKCAGVFDDLFGVDFEIRLECFSKGDGSGRDGVHVRSALKCWEDSGVDGFCVFAFAHNHAATWSTQGFVRGRGYDVSDRERADVLAANNKAGDVCDVSDEFGATFFGDFGEFLEIDFTWISGSAAKQKLWFHIECDFADLSKINQLCFGIERVVVGVVESARKVDFPTVGQVSAKGQAH